MSKTYTTKQGDMWDLIAYKQLGSCKHTAALIYANTKYHDTYIFPANIILVLPEVENDTAAPLPPWKVKRGLSNEQ